MGNAPQQGQKPETTQQLTAEQIRARRGNYYEKRKDILNPEAGKKSPEGNDAPVVSSAQLPSSPVDTKDNASDLPPAKRRKLSPKEDQGSPKPQQSPLPPSSAGRSDNAMDTSGSTNSSNSNSNNASTPSKPVPVSITAPTSRRTPSSSSSSMDLSSSNAPGSSPSAPRNPTPVKTPALPIEEVRAMWDYAILGETLSLTLEKGEAGRVYLPSFASEHLENLRFGRDMIDQVLLERMGLPFSSGTTAIGYLVSCYRKAQERLSKADNDLSALRSERKGLPAQVAAFPVKTSPEDIAWCKQGLESLSRSLITSSGIVLQGAAFDGSVELRQQNVNEFRRLLEADPGMSRALPNGFLGPLVDTFDGEGLDEIFSPIFDELSKPLQGVTVYTKPQELLAIATRRMHSLNKLCCHAPLALLLLKHQNFSPAVYNGRQFEQRCFLGPVLSVWCNPASGVFSSASSRHLGEVEAEVQQMQGMFGTYQHHLCTLFKHLIKDPNNRERTLAWIAKALRLNFALHRMHFDPLTVASEGFCINLSVILASLAHPIVDPKQKKSKFASIELSYLFGTSSDRIDYSNITRLFASAQDVEALRKLSAEKALHLTQTPTKPRADSAETKMTDDTKLATPASKPESKETKAETKQSSDDSKKSPLPKSDGKVNFVTECFFMTHEALTMGYLKVVEQYSRMMSEIARLQRHLQSMDHSNESNRGVLEQLRVNMDQMIAVAFSLRVHLAEPTVIQGLIQIYNWTAQWLVSLATGPEKHLLLPLMPEHIIEDINNFFTYLSRFNHKELISAIEGGQVSGLLDFIVTFMSGPNALKNPHLRGMLPELLLQFVPADRFGGMQYTRDHHIFNTHASLKTTLVPSLLELYADVESLRGHQFYEKFTTRNIIAEILEFLWSFPSHRQTLVELGKNTKDNKFLKFINCLANDVILLLDDALKGLKGIREEQLEMDNVAQWRSQPQNVQQQREASFHQRQGQTHTMMRLANATVHMLFYMTTEIVEPFVCPEFVDRAAGIVTYYIDKMVGPTIAELKVRDKEQYEFYPRTLLREMAGIYLHLSSSKAFVQAIAKDERSYSKAIFAKAARTVESKAILPRDECVKFAKLNEEVAAAWDALQEQEDALGDIPEKYQDALMQTLMTDPVLLPQSKVIVDRANIKRHLLNDQRDPYTSTPLSLDMVQSQDELKKEIEAWVAERRRIAGEKRAKRKEVAESKTDSSLMDVATEGMDEERDLKKTRSGAADLAGGGLGSQSGASNNSSVTDQSANDRKDSSS